MGEHRPTLPVTTQLSHAPVHPELQQVPSTQLPLVQSVPVLQVSPFGSLSPQRLVCRLHEVLSLQSPLLRQVFMQLGLVVLQTYRPHETVAAAGQPPLPSQFTDRLRVPALQLAERHPVEVDHVRHAPPPLHVPSREQSPPPGLLAWHRPLGSGLPEGTDWHFPIFPATLQVLQSPERVSSPHSLSQHTPSLQ
jgi:hypothetical protein